MLKPRYTREEFARRGDLIYTRTVSPRIRGEDDGKFVAIDIETEAFEVDRDDFTATDRLLGRRPDAQIWLTRVGQRAAYRIA